MPVFLILIAVLLIVVGIKGNYPALGAQFDQTFFPNGSASGGFFTWFGSIFALAVIFRLIQAPKAGELFIGLLILVYFLQHNNVLTAIENAIGTGAASGSASASTSITPAVPGTPGTASTGTAASVTIAPPANSVSIAPPVTPAGN